MLLGRWRLAPFIFPMTFLEPHRLFWLVLLPALAVVVAVAGVRHRRNLHRFATPERLSVTLPTRSKTRAVARVVLLLACLGLTLVALADPRRGEREREVPPSDSVSVVFALDVSRSMLAQDVSPTRLDRAKQYVREFVGVLNEQEDDASVGLVAFAGAVKRVTPLTRNTNELELALQATDTTSAGVGGSNLADAVQVAARSFVERRPGHKVVVMLTDGEENHSGEPASAARAAFEGRGVRFFPLGLGSPDTGATIPIGNGQVMTHAGQPVKTTLDAAALMAVAEDGGGVYIPAQTKRADMAQVYRRVIRPRLSATQDAAQQGGDGPTVKTMIPRFGWLAWPALVLLLVERLIAGWPVPRRGVGRAAAVLVVFAAVPTLAQEAPVDPLTAYNTAVAAQQSGDLDQALEGFAHAAQRGTGQVEARARYNLGRAVHGQAIAALHKPEVPSEKPSADATGPATPQADPLSLLDQAVREYAAALGADPAFDDARANLEAAARLRAKLRQQREEQKQQQDAQQDQQQAPPEQDGEESEDQTSQDSGQMPEGAPLDGGGELPGEAGESNTEQEGENSETSSQEGSSSEAQPDDSSQDSPPSESETPGEPGDTDGGSEAADPASAQDPDVGEGDNPALSEGQSPSPDGQAGEAGQALQGEPQNLSPDEAMKLLQRIRDQDLQRRITQYRREAQRQQAVEKDW